MPGMSARPPASTVSLADSRLFPTSTIFPSRTPTSASRAGAPVPSRTAAPRMSRSSKLVRAAEGVVPVRVRHVGDRRVAVDQRPAEEAVLRAAHLVLDLEQLLLRRLRVDDPLEAPLRLVHLHADE